MQFIKHIYLFTINNVRQLMRKWFLLPLILLFPIFIVGSVITLIVLFIFPSDDDPIAIGIVDHDQSMETEVVIQLLEESAELGPFITVESMSESDAKQRISNDELSAYITFPKQFTHDLYIGESVSLNVAGNMQREADSYIVKEILDSLMRHIRTSQATILMINEYAKKTTMSDEERQELIFEQFTKSLISVGGKDKIISEKTLTNYMTASPIHYYAISIVFILILIWLLTFYNILYQTETNRLSERMKLYGVTHYQQILARMIVTVVLTGILGSGSFSIMQYVLQFDLDGEDIVRITSITLLHSVIYLQLLAICEMIISSQRLRLLIQLLVTLLLLGLSGAILPVIYFPLSLQDVISYVPSYDSLFWLQEILLNERFYADVNQLLIYVMCGFICLSILSFWKERVRT